MTQSAKTVFTVAIFALAAVLMLPGCGRDKPPAEQAPASSSSQPAPPAAAKSNDAAPATTALVATVDAEGRKWLTPEVPYDVFTDVPSDQDATVGAADGRASAPALTTAGKPPSEEMASRTETGNPPAQAASGDEPAPMPSTAMAGDAPDAGDWSAVLPLDVLRNEIASIGNGLGEKLLTVGSYNAAFEEVSADGWVMSALATIVSEYPDQISWQANSLLARDRAVAVAMAATARGRQSFNDAQLANEQLAAIVNNNVPAGLPDPDPAASREETADRAALMARMQSAFDSLKEASADDAAFRAGRETALHEAAVLAALATFTAHSDYGSADEPDYQTPARDLVAAGIEMANAAGSEDPESFKTAFDKVGTACNTCHEKYRFEN